MWGRYSFPMNQPQVALRQRQLQFRIWSRAMNSLVQKSLKINYSSVNNLFLWRLDIGFTNKIIYYSNKLKICTNLISFDKYKYSIILCWRQLPSPLPIWICQCHMVKEGCKTILRGSYSTHKIMANVSTNVVLASWVATKLPTTSAKALPHQVGDSVARTCEYISCEQTNAYHRRQHCSLVIVCAKCSNVQH